nr:putative ribonuclease H-like domain-containing protein [Tanacetum cinerariifolium]
MFYLSNFKEFDKGYVTFGGGAKYGRITGKGTLKTGKLDFKDVYFVKELKFNLLSVLQMCDKKNSVLFTDTRCFVLSPNFKLADESHVLLKVPRNNNMYNVDIMFVDSPFDLEAYTDSDYVGASLDWKSTTGGFNDEYDTPSYTKKVFANMRRQGKDFSRRVTPLFETMLIQHPAEVGKDETIHKDKGDRVERVATTASSLKAEQDSEGIRGAMTKMKGFHLVKRMQRLRGGMVRILNAPITTSGVSVSTAKPSTPPKATTLVEDEDLIIAHTLMKIKVETTTRPTVPPQQQLDPKDKGKGKMVELEKPLKKKDQIALDEEVARKLEAQMQAELEEEERLAR